MASLYIAGVDLENSRKWDFSADGTTRIGGTIKKSTAGEIVVAQYQLKGMLQNPDEESGVPVVPSADSTLTGLYRVLGGNIEVGPPAYSGSLRWFDYELEIQRVLPVASPRVESRLLGALRTNSHSIVVGSTVPWWAVPDAATMDYVAGATRQTRTTADGDVAVNYTTNGTLLYDATQVWQCPAASWYVGAARVEITGDGSNWERLPGTQLGTVNPASAVGWRLNNGLVRVSYGGGSGLLSVQHYVSGSWITAKVYKLTRGISPSSPTALGTFCAMRIMRNSPEETVVRLSIEQDSTTYPAQVNVDLCLRRGARWVDVTVTRDPQQVSAAELASTDFPFGIYRNTSEAGTTHTSGVHATSADAGGGKYILTSPTATNVDTTIGGIAQGTGVNTFQFMIGYEPGSASGADTFTNQVYSYFAAVSETARLARR